MLKNRDEVNKMYLETLDHTEPETVMNYYNTLNRFVWKEEENLNKNIENFSLEDWVVILKTKKISLNYFYQVRNIVRGYFNFLIEQREIDAQRLILDSMQYKVLENNGRYRERYWKNLDDILEFIDNVLEHAGRDKVIRQGLSLLILLFHELTYEEISNLQKQDLKTKNLVAESSEGERVVPIDERAMKYLKEFSHDNVKMVLEKSKGLPYQRQTFQSALSRLVKDIQLPFNNKYYGKRIIPKAVYDSARFSKFLSYLLEQDIDLTEITYKENCMDFLKSFTDFVNFTQWMEYFYDIDSNKSRFSKKAYRTT